jgi:predicted fused transcriptional regulator/phosphomethylpyrimidine kinase
VEAVKQLADCPDAAKLLPEIRSNLVMALADAKNISEIAGIPGRLTEVFGRITAPAYPAWGASKNTARILLAVMKVDPSRRAAMEIKYSEQVIEIIQAHGLKTALLPSGCESLEQTIHSCLIDQQLPPVLYTAGGWDREGAIIITAVDAVEIAHMVSNIAAWCSQ